MWLKKQSRQSNTSKSLVEMTEKPNWLKEEKVVIYREGETEVRNNYLIP